jgi:SAM-dependent methyltransferase
MDSKAIGKILGPRFDGVSLDGARALKELGLPADAAILDVGTGSGNFAIYLASQGYQVLTGEPGTDKSRYAGQDWALNAKRAGVLKNIRFEAFDASKLPFEPEAFDAVFYFGVLHHIDENVRGQVLREGLRVSKEGGAVVFFEPRKEMLEKIWVDDPGHPLAANPSDYLPEPRTREHRIQGSAMEGSLMNIFIYKKPFTAVESSQCGCQPDRLQCQ